MQPKVSVINRLPFDRDESVDRLESIFATIKTTGHADGEREGSEVQDE